MLFFHALYHNFQKIRYRISVFQLKYIQYILLNSCEQTACHFGHKLFVIIFFFLHSLSFDNSKLSQQLFDLNSEQFHIRKTQILCSRKVNFQIFECAARV